MRCQFWSALVLLLAGFVFEPSIPGADASASRRPNIVIILADDLGYSDVGCYGGEIETPHLDALAEGGLRFTQFYNTARCWPTRGALMTGYYAQAIRRDNLPGQDRRGAGNRGDRPEWARLLPQLLQPAGYRSYHSGKWHIDGLNLAGGFVHSYDLKDQSRFFSPRKHTLDDKPLPAVQPDSGYYATQAIADHAIDMLQEHAADHKASPFLLYLAFTSPHFPLHAPPEDIARYSETYRAGWDAIRAARWEKIRRIGLVQTPLSDVEADVGPPYHFPEAYEKFGPGEVRYPRPWSELTEVQREFQATKMAIHAAMVDRMDREIGRVLQQVRDMGVWDDTFICFLSDNGASAEIMVRGDGHDPEAAPGSAMTHLCLGPGWSTVANTPFRRHKTWVHEGGISTPFIAHWPRGISARNELRHAPGHVVDIVPTALDLAGLDPAAVVSDGPPLHGRSLKPVFTADSDTRAEPIWFLHEDNRALRAGDWKLVAAKGDPWELYNLRTDRCETHNLAEQHPERVRELEAAWQARVDEFRQRLESEAAAR